MTAKQWNELYPVGTRVIVWRDNGQALCTTTRSAAWDLDVGVPVVQVVGIPGCYALEKVRLACKMESAAACTIH